MREQGRFAPSATGRAHPGTLLAALLCWLDARARGAQVLLRLEDLDHERCRDEFRQGLIDDLRWFGLSFDAIEQQSAQSTRHAAALDELAAQGRLYPSDTGRAELARLGRRAPDGGFAYDNRDRGCPLPVGGWRACREPLRCQIADGPLMLGDEDGSLLGGDPAHDFGDPVVVRRDGAVSYQLAVVVDDAASGVTRVVRGRDIAPSTAIQARLMELLGITRPVWRHHALLLEARGRKLAKLHGAVAAPELRRHYSPAALCGWLAHCAGLRPAAEPCQPADLIAEFTWDRVRRDDVLVTWDGQRLALG